MRRLMSTPAGDGFHMPAEYEPHRGCVMIWPERPGSWPDGAKEAQKAFTEVARAIAKSEQVWMLAAPKEYEEVCAVFREDPRITPLMIETDDAWARDIGPSCVVNAAGTVRGVDWQFNAWGGSYDGLYAHWDRDDQAAGRICEALDLDCYDAKPFVLEGGAVHSDGEGTLLVTEACLLSPGRNPYLTKGQIEEKLKDYLGAKKVIWLPRGIWQDETDEHVDNICAFVRPAEVVLAWTDDPCDPQWELSNASLRVLERETDAKGRPFIVHRLCIPKNPVCVTSEELSGLTFEKGEEVRRLGERLPASYVNFYISNDSVLVPQFDDEMDKEAVNLLGELFPERMIVPINARPILIGGGNIHCITQQIPLGERL